MWVFRLRIKPCASAESISGKKNSEKYHTSKRWNDKKFVEVGVKGEKGAANGNTSTEITAKETC